MEIGSLDHERLVEPEGGSLNGTLTTDDEFIKDYAGPLSRGYSKLELEFAWLRSLPKDVATHFPQVTGFYYDARKPFIELRLERIKRPALAKAILLGKITPERVRHQLDATLSFLTNDLYPLRRAQMSGVDVYEQFHGHRMARAITLLSTTPDYRRLLTAGDLRVNGLTCPSAEEMINWLHDHAGDFFQDSRLVAGHGDCHLDNIMVATEGPLDFHLVDPRGDQLLPPHYDLAKLLKALRTGYDLVHYGGFGIEVEITPSGSSVSLAISSAFDAYYRAGMYVLLDAVKKFAHAEDVSESAFVGALLVAEYAHLISFASYHANRPEGPDIKRVSAYLAIAALLARDLKAGSSDIVRPLPIWGETV